MVQEKMYNKPTGKRGTRSSSLWLVGVFTIVAAIIANLIVRALAFALLPLPAEFLPLTVPPVVLFTLIGVAAAAGVYALVRRFTRRVVPIYSVIVVFALLISLIPNFLILRDLAVSPFPGATGPAIGVLMTFHCVAAGVSIGILTKMAPPVQEHAPSPFRGI